MPQCFIYVDQNFGGASYLLTNSAEDFTKLSQGWPGSNFNDEVSSIKIVEGTWEFFEHTYFQGKSWKLEPGDYPFVGNVGIPNDTISSARWVP